jgi:hypothetical protein
MIDYSLILNVKYKNDQWTINGDDYFGITWNSESRKPTKEELDSQWEEVLQIKKKDNCKNQAKILIFNCDWSVLPDVNIYNRSEFESYRAILRNYILNPVENPDFPTEPVPKWIFTTKTMGDNNG